MTPRSDSRPTFDTFVHSPSPVLPLKRANHEHEVLDEIPTQTAEQLAQALNMSARTVHLPQTNTTSFPIMRSAAALASQRRGTTITKFPTHFLPLDKLLEGGIPRGRILELSGPPGAPKGRVAVGVVRSFLEAEEGVLFVDCQNMSNPRILEETLKDLPNHQTLLSYLKVSALLQFVIFIHNLGTYLLAHPTLSLLVIDTISFPFQSTTDIKTSAKTSMFDQIKRTLVHDCAAHNLTVVITSQLATKLFNPDGSPGNFESGAKGVLVPQLGPAYLPAGRTYRVILSRETADTGLVRILSSPEGPRSTMGSYEPFHWSPH
ncbi:hypothetical protein E1B28_006121 [Marasmius oreades]|uniref:Uncharacterized protein n=1 Tax=Marasmius oreades TaxID=181124 RepID=A0A9P7S5A3_9AGAR|nr:uncharacterized protein E1B28_006121 [Marasmius oreades]KAG7095362.1 hypothetical protein E1B28_006121 [Marasmius oreades]